VNKVGQAAARMSNAAEGRIADAAQAAANSAAGEANGALGPAKAAFNKAIERLNAALRDGRLNSEQYAKLSNELANHVKAGNTDLIDDALRTVEQFKPGLPTNPETLFPAAKAGVENAQKEAMNAQLRKDGMNLLYKAPLVGGTIEATVTLGKHAIQRMSSDVAKRGLGEKIARALLSNPQLSEKYGRVIMGAASPSVAHNVLQQRDPEYREAIKKALLEQGDGN
jgi:hypothetical protein